MKTVEKTYALFSPAADGGEKKLGEVRAVISRLAAAEAEQGETVSARESAVACVMREEAPQGGFCRGMSLSRGGICYRVDGAVQSARLWVLRLSRTLMDGEA